MKCLNCVFLEECKKFNPSFVDVFSLACHRFVVTCPDSKTCTAKKCLHNSDRPIFNQGNYSELPLCGADPRLIIQEKNEKREKKIKAAFKKGLRIGAKITDFKATVTHWFWDANDVLQCCLSFPAGSGSLGIGAVKFTGENAYERMDGGQRSPKLPEFLSPTGYINREPIRTYKKRREETWFVTVFYDIPNYVAHITCESESVVFTHRTMEETKLHLQKILDSYELDPQKTFAFGFEFVPDWFRCTVK